MDESAARYYMPTTMRLLLLLSAFLTSMVGVGTPAAAAVRPACELTVTATARAERQTPRLAVVPPRKSGVLDRVNFVAAALDNAPVPTTPLYTQRLRV